MRDKKLWDVPHLYIVLGSLVCSNKMQGQNNYRSFIIKGLFSYPVPLHYRSTCIHINDCIAPLHKNIIRLNNMWTVVLYFIFRWLCLFISLNIMSRWANLHLWRKIKFASENSFHYTKIRPLILKLEFQVKLGHTLVPPGYLSQAFVDSTRPTYVTP